MVTAFIVLPSPTISNKFTFRIRSGHMAPVDSSPRGNMGGFELICSLKAIDTIPVHMYKSLNTGITVCIAEIDGPIVNGYFNLGNCDAHR